MVSHPRLWRNIRPVRTLAVLVGVALLACGCATPGEPTARQIIIPQVVQDLQARQQGATILLSFTLPDQTTRKEPLAAPPAVEIYRGESAAGAGAKAAAKAPAKTIYTIPGEMTDTYRTGGKIVNRYAIDSA